MNLYIFFAVVIIILVFVIVLLHSRMVVQKQLLEKNNKDFENQKSQLIMKHQIEIEDLNRLHQKDVDSIKERIETDKRKLEQLSEKELLSSIIIALEGYGSRISRLESLIDQQNEETVYTQINEMLQEISESIEKKTEFINDKYSYGSIADDVASIESKVDEILEKMI